jgi:hypothetical protein
VNEVKNEAKDMIRKEETWMAVEFLTSKLMETTQKQAQPTALPMSAAVPVEPTAIPVMQAPGEVTIPNTTVTPEINLSTAAQGEPVIPPQENIAAPQTQTN